jgi:hypothetical protein
MLFGGARRSRARSVDDRPSGADDTSLLAELCLSQRSTSPLKGSALEAVGRGPVAAAGQPDAVIHVIARIQEIILRDCGFLRIRDWMFRYPERDAPYHGVLTVIVAGLPWRKQKKWFMPLQWAVQSVLQRRGLHATVRNYKLFLTDEATRFRMCIDFAPCLEPCRPTDFGPLGPVRKSAGWAPGLAWDWQASHQPGQHPSPLRADRPMDRPEVFSDLRSEHVVLLRAVGLQLAAAGRGADAEMTAAGLSTP